MPALPPNRRLTVFSGLFGLFYGLLARLVFGRDDLNVFLKQFEVMTVAFLFLVPFSIGAISVYLAERGGRLGVGGHIFYPWVPALTSLACALALAWEGLICIALWIPIFSIMSSLGGLTAALIRRIAGSGGNAMIATLAILPFALGPLEHRWTPAAQQREVQTAIDIDASPDTVWQQIVTVRRFRPEEHHFSVTHFIGFPRPVEATLVGEGVGAYRRATFERGVLFIETITEWEPNRALAFGIHADSANIPPTTLDQHVTLGGPYFDVLQGRYEIEPLGPNKVRLHLSSVHRLSTRFNAYSGLWTDFIMGDVQRYILGIVKARAEHPSN